MSVDLTLSTLLLISYASCKLHKVFNVLNIFLQSKPISLATFSLVEISANTEMRLLIFVINSASKCVVHVEMRAPMGLAVS